MSLESTEDVCLMALNIDAKFEEKLTCASKNAGKFSPELRVMIMKNYAKFEEELTCRFKIDMRNLTNFDRSTQKSKKFAL